MPPQTLNLSPIETLKRENEILNHALAIAAEEHLMFVNAKFGNTKFLINDWKEKACHRRDRGFVLQCPQLLKNKMHQLQRQFIKEEIN